jgi:hypothetical protein
MSLDTELRQFFGRTREAAWPGSGRPTTGSCAAGPAAAARSPPPPV